MEGRSSGFTLIELMVTLAMAAIIVTLAAPNLRGLVQSNRAASASNSFVTALNLARTAAVQRSIAVSICPRSSPTSSTCGGSGAWANGWIVFQDATGGGSVGSSPIIRVFSKLDSSGTLTISGGDSFLTFDPTGLLVHPTSGVTFTLQMSDCTGQSNRTISVDPQGLISSEAASC